jgi:hypothetical protein
MPSAAMTLATMSRLHRLTGCTPSMAGRTGLPVHAQGARYGGAGI